MEQKHRNIENYKNMEQVTFNGKTYNVGNSVVFNKNIMVDMLFNDGEWPDDLEDNSYTITNILVCDIYIALTVLSPEGHISVNSIVYYDKA